MAHKFALRRLANEGILRRLWREGDRAMLVNWEENLLFLVSDFFSPFSLARLSRKTQIAPAFTQADRACFKRERGDQLRENSCE